LGIFKNGRKKSSVDQSNSETVTKGNENTRSTYPPPPKRNKGNIPEVVQWSSRLREARG
jgi:hypothetical protein